jgi:hypothetical protein
MSRSTTAVVLSALVLPGAGHLYLKQAGRGMALIAVSLACLWIIIAQAMQQASAVLAQLESEGVVPDAGQLADLVSHASSHSESGSMTLATLVLIGCWLFGIIDAYRLGKRDAGGATQIR